MTDITKVVSSDILKGAAPLNRFQQGGYNESRSKRITVMVDHYGKDALRGKTMLEVGAGYGDMGAEFARTHGMKVTCTEGRPEYVEQIKERHPKVEAALQDIEQPWPFTEKFDFLLVLGVLHHINPASIEPTLKEAFAISDNIVIDHEVTDKEDPYLIVTEDERGTDQSIRGVGCRPTTAYMERLFTELGMQFERCTDDRINGPADFTWEAGEAPAIGPRRFWFVWR